MSAPPETPVPGAAAGVPAQFRRLWRLLVPDERRALLTWVAPMLMAALADVAGIGLILPLADALLSEPDRMGPMGRALLSVLSLVGGDPLLRMTLAGVLFALVFVSKSLFLWFVQSGYLRVVYAIQHRIMANLYGAYLTMPMARLAERHSAERHRNLLQSTGLVIGNGYLPAFSLVLECLTSMGILVLLLAINPKALFLAMALTGAVAWWYFRIFNPRLHAWGRYSLDLEGDLIRLNNHTLALLPEIKVRGCESFFDRQFHTIASPLTGVRRLVQLALLVPRLVMEPMAVILLVGVMLSAGFSGGVANGSSQAAVAVFLAAIVRLLPGILRIIAHVSALRVSTAAAEELTRDLARGPEDSPSRPGHSSGPLPDRWSTLGVRDVSFTYPGHERPALQGVSFSFARGERIAVAGHSGSGKSTLINILLGLFDQCEGSVMLDGTDVRSDLTAWRRMIGYVPQQIELLDGSLRTNIALGLEADEIDECAVWDALELAHLAEYVRSLPEGLETRVGERGARLSGGQRQRIGLARAFYHHPSLLVLDEATSALDNETEQAVTAAIDSLSRDVTVIIIAHRLDTLRKCARLAFLKEGRLLGFGGFDQLKAENPDFARFAALAGQEEGGGPGGFR